MYSKDLVTNTSTGLMAIKDLATFNDVPINIHFDKHWIHIKYSARPIAFIAI